MAHDNDPLFEDNALDDVLLTDEEYAEYLSLTTENHDSLKRFREEKFGFPQGSFASLESQLDLEYHSASSDSSEHSSLSVKSSKSSGDDNAKPKYRPRINPVTLEEKPNANSVSNLSYLPANEWNNFPQNVYSVFGIKYYIVEPDYFLAASMSKSTDGQPVPVLDEFLTISHLYNMISGPSSCRRFPPWSDIEPQISRLLVAFADTKDLPDMLYDKDASMEIILNFKNRLRRIRMEVHDSSSCLVQCVLTLLDFVNELLDAVKEQRFLEILSVTYIMIFITHFEKLLGSFPLTHRENEEITLDLENRKTKQGRKMTVKPDITIYYQNVSFLVGEVKSYQFKSKGIDPSQKNSKSEKHRRSGTDMAGYDDTPKPETPCSGIAHPKEVGAGDEEHSHSGPVAKKMRLAEKDTPSTSSDWQRESESQVGDGGDAQAGEPNKTVSDAKTGASSGNENMKMRHFRNLKKEEQIKVKRYLPQMFAEMLAAREKQTRSTGRAAHLGRDNESVQLGFAVEGFKMRFVRLVLRNVNEDGIPTVAMIRNPNIKCDMFLTKEFNLFNKRHLKMIFQMLYAFTYAYDYI